MVEEDRMPKSDRKDARHRRGKKEGDSAGKPPRSVPRPGVVYALLAAVVGGAIVIFVIVSSLGNTGCGPSPMVTLDDFTHTMTLASGAATITYNFTINNTRGGAGMVTVRFWINDTTQPWNKSYAVEAGAVARESEVFVWVTGPTVTGSIAPNITPGPEAPRC